MAAVLYPKAGEVFPLPEERSAWLSSFPSFLNGKLLSFLNRKTKKVLGAVPTCRVGGKKKPAEPRMAAIIPYKNKGKHPRSHHCSLRTYGAAIPMLTMWDTWEKQGVIWGISARSPGEKFRPPVLLGSSRRGDLSTSLTCSLAHLGYSAPGGIWASSILLLNAIMDG